MNNTDMTRHVLISGVAFGVITAIPPFSFLNVCTCCSLFAAAGFLTTYLLRRDSVEPITTGRGAVAGIATGVLGGAVHTVFSIPLELLLQKMMPFNEDLASKILEGLGDDNSQLAALVREIASQASSAAALFSAVWFVVTIVKLVMTVLLFALFSMLGGILAVAILEKRQPPVVYVPPPPPTEPPIAPVTYGREE